jgi:hypothetical protein
MGLHKQITTPYLATNGETPLLICREMSPGVASTEECIYSVLGHLPSRSLGVHRVAPGVTRRYRLKFHQLAVRASKTENKRVLHQYSQASSRLV